MATYSNSDVEFPSKPVLNDQSQPEKFSLLGSHDPAIFRDPSSGIYYTYSTGAICRRSRDLITWENIGKVVESPPPAAVKWVGSDGIWAPDIIKVGDEYRLYCSNSTWGVRQSCIFLAVANNPEGPFIPRDLVLKTNDESPVNAIDANLIIDENTQEHYMVYGSFWGGCYILKLDPKTGLAAEPGFGKCVAKRPFWMENSIEGPYIKYNPDTGYYYLFVSYGSLKSDYNIRVGRSLSVTGPYYDYHGRALTDTEDYTNEVGYMIACGYHFDRSQGTMAPGHNSILHDFDNQWYLVCHVRGYNISEPQRSTMHIHKMFWTEDGWPVLNPQRYAGEKSQPIARELLIGNYERIKLVPSVPQGVVNSVPMSISDDGQFHCCSIRGEWELINDYSLKISFGNIEEIYLLTPAWDWQLDQPTIVITGKDQFGINVWAKKVSGD